LLRLRQERIDRHGWRDRSLSAEQAARPRRIREQAPAASKAPSRQARNASAPAKQAPPPKPEPKPQLKIRKASKADAAALSELVKEAGAEHSTREIVARLGSLLKAKEPPIVADLAGVVGCAAYHLVPTLQHGSVGRLTMLVVAERARQRHWQGAARSCRGRAEAGGLLADRGHERHRLRARAPFLHADGL
jgi:hypothetical protein